MGRRVRLGSGAPLGMGPLRPFGAEGMGDEGHRWVKKEALGEWSAEKIPEPPPGPPDQARLRVMSFSSEQGFGDKEPPPGIPDQAGLRIKSF